MKTESRWWFLFPFCKVLSKVQNTLTDTCILNLDFQKGLRITDLFPILSYPYRPCSLFVWWQILLFMFSFSVIPSLFCFTRSCCLILWVCFGTSCWLWNLSSTLSIFTAFYAAQVSLLLRKICFTRLTLTDIGSALK